MKCIFEDNIILIYVQKSNINEKNFEKLSYIEEYFKNIFLKIKQKYNIDMNGFYFVNVYIDSIYGIILEIKEEKLEFIDYYDDAVDMKLSLYQEPFLYRIEDILDLQKSLKPKFDIYLYQNNWYIKPKDLTEDTLLYKILEYTEIIYKDTSKIINYGKKI